MSIILIVRETLKKNYFYLYSISESPCLVSNFRYAADRQEQEETTSDH